VHDHQRVHDEQVKRVREVQDECDEVVRVHDVEQSRRRTCVWSSTTSGCAGGAGGGARACARRGAEDSVREVQDEGDEVGLVHDVEQDVLAEEEELG